MESLRKEPERYLNNPKIAINAIAEALSKGCLALFIGAGISKSATDNFPKWDELVKVCCEKQRIDFDQDKASTDNEYLLTRIDEVKEKCSTDEEYIELVKSVLYDNVKYNTDLMSRDLLIAMGSLIMGSIRGNSDCIINYNFDDLFEWYLDYHGFKTQVISEYPSLIIKSDANIYHPHGFLPLTEKYKNSKTNRIILSSVEYETAIAKEVNPWNEFQRHILSTKCGLFIGMSGDDKHVSSLCNYIYSGKETVDRQRILGFIILKDNAVNRDKEVYNKRRGLINLYITEYSDLPVLLFTICQKAVELRS